MTDTPNLNLPYLLAAQAQKHVTHNDALRGLDCVVQLMVLDRDLATPPVVPAEGDRYIVAASPTGAWAGQTNKIAAFQDAAWMFYAPVEGWLAWVSDENDLVVFEGAGWASVSSGGGGGVTDHGLLTGLTDDDHTQYHNNARGDARYTLLNPATLGVNATPDATNKLAVNSAASLFNHAGTGGHQMKLNKAAAADTASFLFQTAFSGRAELGTTGDDDFHFKVSTNGTAWNEAIVIDRATGAVEMPNTNCVTVQTFASSGTWTKPAGCVRVRVRAVGGGGGGAGSTATASASCCGGGGGAGAYGEGNYSVTATSSVAVTVGSGGASGAAANGAGGVGGASSFGALLTAPGGNGGLAMASGTAAGVSSGGSNSAAASGGYINAAGASGGFGNRESATVVFSGPGASSVFGGGPRGFGAGAAGAAGGAPGAGGSGAVSTSATGFTGGSGAVGMVIVEEFY